MKINIKVKPNSNKSEFLEKQRIVFLKSRPENNQANIELIKLLKKHFKASEVKIIKGLKSREKILEIECQ
jgi:uncharacterized protein (TIGR00251 family)